ncbi:MAG TPA: phosphatase PAP2 family protein [Jatrophihabitantaceae bacterium]|jgi:membrane-associated phospholipid phosphatase|nr:phosphatase PAP2 family protein [Jatrophihabitantaceae bacterium]
MRTRLAQRLTPEVVEAIRWSAVFVWVCALGVQIRLSGIPFDRESVILWLMGGAFALTIGRRAAWTVLVDWLPFALVLLAYDFARGASDTLGMPTWWTPQLNVDKFLFGGTEPTVWLQEHVKYAHAQWWDVVVTATYISFFLLPYVVAAVLWVRSRTDFHRWTGRFVSLSLFGFVLFALLPTAPPWAAARCTGPDVAAHPSSPACMGVSPASVPSGGLLGRMTHHQQGALPYIERLSGRGWSELHLTAAQALLAKGQATSNLVAAVPSLHAGGAMLLAIFLWRRIRKGWKLALVAYNLAMAFSLVYAAEHYVSDILAGWLCAALVSLVFDYVERQRARGRWQVWRRGGSPGVDTLDAPTPAAARTTEPADAMMES